MRKIKLKEFFLSLGYNIDVFLSHIKSVKEYSQWYYGIVESFHKYYIFNGDKKVYKNRYSLCLPKKICENFADLICNEKTKISLSSDSATNKLNEILDDNSFYIKASQAVEKSFAAGIGAFVVSADSEKGIKIQFVSAENIIPLSYDSDRITECAFISDVSYLNDDDIRYIQVHKKDKNGNYSIFNYKFRVESDDNLNLISDESLPEVIATGSDVPWFSIIKPNIVNNIDINSPFGIPIFFNALDTIKTLDIIYDSFVNEIQNGRKRLFVTSEALKVNSSGELKNAFDPNDVVFYLLDSNVTSETTTQGRYVQEVNGTLRIPELRLAFQTNLELLSLKLGLGRDYFRLGNDNGIMKTATEVVASNSDLYRTVHKHEISVEEALKDLIKAIQFISKNLFNNNINGDIFIDFDDSVIESDVAKREQDRLDVAMGAMTLEEYRSIWYDEPIEVARTMISERAP